MKKPVNSRTFGNTGFFLLFFVFSLLWYEKLSDPYPLEDGIDILHVVIQCEAGIDFFFGEE